MLLLLVLLRPLPLRLLSPLLVQLLLEQHLLLILLLPRVLRTRTPLRPPPKGRAPSRRT